MASNLRGYSADEVLNKVLNTSNDSIQVDVVSGSEYAEDSVHSSTDVGTFVLGVRQDSIAALGADGDYVPFQVNASGALYVEVASTGTAGGVHVDDAAFTLGSHSGMMMMGFAGTQSVDANDAGAIAMDTDGAIHIADGGNTITVDGTVSVSGLLADGHAVTIDNTDSNEVYVRGSGTAGSADAKVLTVQGIASGTALEVVGDAAENANAAGNPVLIGGRYDNSGANDGGLRTLDTTDVGALALDPKGVLLTKDFTGQAGSILVTGTSAVAAGYGKFIAIQFIEDTVFSSSANGLSASDVNRWPDDTGIGSDISSNGAAIDGVTFPQGMTIFGRWDDFTLASGKVIAYIGYV